MRPMAHRASGVSVSEARVMSLRWMMLSPASSVHEVRGATVAMMAEAERIFNAVFIVVVIGERSLWYSDILDG